MPRTTVAELASQVAAENAELRSELAELRSALEEISDLRVISHNLVIASGNLAKTQQAMSETLLAHVESLRDSSPEPSAQTPTPSTPSKKGGKNAKPSASKPASSPKKRPANKGAKAKFDSVELTVDFVDEDGNPRLSAGGRHHGYGVDGKQSLRLYSDTAIPVGDSVNVVITSGADHKEGLVLWAQPTTGKTVSYQSVETDFGFAEGTVRLDAYFRVPRKSGLPEAVTVYFQ